MGLRGAHLRRRWHIAHGVAATPLGTGVGVGAVNHFGVMDVALALRGLLNRQPAT